MKRLFILAAWSVVLGAHAEFKDGNGLLSDMNGSHSKQMYALGYVAGAADSFMGVTVCPPATVTTGQMHDMVKQYLEAYPAVRHFSGDVIINRVLSNAWPCARRGQAL